jgi:hypothetical protein
MRGIAARGSLYPLRTGRFNPATQRADEICRAHRLAGQPGPWSTVGSGGDAAVFAA